MTTDTVALEQEVHELLSRLGVPERRYSEGELVVRTPITGQVIARVATTTESAAREAIGAAHEAFLKWRNVPAPGRGELVRVLGEELRAEIETLGRLVTIETGKLLSEGVWRSAGDDRYLWFRCWIIETACGANDCVGAREPPDDGDVAPAGSGGGDLGVQFSGCGVVVECGAGAGVRKCCGVEAFGEDAADGVGDACAV